MDAPVKKYFADSHKRQIGIGKSETRGLNIKKGYTYNKRSIDRFVCYLLLYNSSDHSSRPIDFFWLVIHLLTNSYININII